jgi:hypothetical protein
MVGMADGSARLNQEFDVVGLTLNGNSPGNASVKLPVTLQVTLVQDQADPTQVNPVIEPVQPCPSPNTG